MADTPKAQPSFSPGRKWRAGFSVVIGIVALLAIVVMANYMSRNYFFHRSFLSSQTRVQLSAQTLGLLKSITNDVKITLYYDKTDPMFNTIAALATEYRLANPGISVETVDYTSDTVSAQRIKAKYELDSPTDKDLVIFECEGRTKRVAGDALTETTLEPVANEREREFRRRPVAFKGEMLFSAMLLAVSSPQPLNAYYLVGHGEHPADKEDDEMGYLKFISLVMQNYVKVQPLTLLGTNTVPADCNLLIIAAPKTTLPETELERIETYLESGGRLLALFNCTTADKQLGLEAVLAKWGVKVGAQTVRDEQRSVRGQDIVISNFGRHPVVNPLLLSSVHMILPRTVGEIDSASTAADAPKVVELAFTSVDSRLNELPDAPPTNYPIAVAVEKGAVPGTSTDQGTTRIVVIGDSLFLGNKMIDSAANRDFAGYAMNWLLDRTQLMEGLGPRPVVEYKLVMTQSQLNSAQWLLLGGLPGAVLLLGALVWLSRRN
jgi:hypothetical protein